MQTGNNKNYCTLYLVRHGETEWNVKKINQGQSDSALTEKGVEQAKETAERLRHINFDAIFSSDLSRAHRTAEIIKLDRELVVETSELLRERSHGSFEGKHQDEIKNLLKDKLNEREKLSDHEYNSFRLAPDIETNEELATRLITKIREISVAYPGKNVLIVTHQGCIKYFLLKIGYITRGNLSSVSLKNGEYIKLLCNGVDFFVKEAEGVRKSEGV